MGWEGASGGWSSRGSGVFTPAALPGLALWLRADQGIAFGGMVAPVATGTTPPAVTFTGVPTADTQSFEVDCTTGGTIGTAQATIKRNGVVVFGPAVFAATEGQFSGVTVSFPGGANAYTNHNVWTTVPSVASWTSIDGSATVFAQATQANQPAWIAPGLVLAGFAAGIGGQPTVRVVGTASQSLTTGAFARALPHTFSLVCVLNAWAASAGWFYSAAGIIGYAGPVTAYSLNEGGTVVSNYCGSTYVGISAAIGFEVTAAGGRILGSKAPIGAGPAPTVAFAGALSLGEYSGAHYLSGDISEVVATGALSVAQVASLQEYRGSYYGLAP